MTDTLTTARPKLDRAAPVYARIVTRDMNDLDAAPLERTINYRNPDDQKWLRNHMFWAFHNARTVTCYPLEA